MRATLQAIAGRKPHWVLFFALFAFYLSFTPGTINGMGYNQENLIGANQIVNNLINLVRRLPLAPIGWPRHGLLEMLFDLPFVVASRLLFGDSLEWFGRVAIIQPIMFTALSCVVAFLWIQRLTKSLAWAYWLSMTAAIATMIWPYTYIGLETTQSLFVILSAYLALAAENRSSRLRLVTFSFACATAISVKSNGVFLTPAIIYLIYCYFFRGHKTVADTLRLEWVRMILAFAIVGGVYFVNRHYSSKYWDAGYGSSSGYFFTLLADGFARVAFNFLSYFGSVNKSLLLYAPVTALGLFMLPQAYRKHPRIAVFAVLTLAGMAGGFSLTYMWADETWGPRYLHEAILPLTVCFASAKAACGKAGAEFRWSRETPLLAAAVLGVVISFLGSFFYYGNLHIAAMEVSQPALESLQHDPRMNHIEFNARLLKVWVRKKFGGVDNPELWPSHYNWWFQKPPDVPKEKTFDLRILASPLPVMAHLWDGPFFVSRDIYQILRLLLPCSLLLSLALFAYLAFLSVRQPIESGQTSSQPTDAKSGAKSAPVNERQWD
ncbi:MAG: hypothetical protein JMDDDDMK_00959 [Acidobacteria bacterium]|nr:hypothetical protein [Acidobacteriota bacterium]